MKKKRQEKGSHKLGVELDIKFSSIDTSSKVWTHNFYLKSNVHIDYI